MSALEIPQRYSTTENVIDQFTGRRQDNFSFDVLLSRKSGFHPYTVDMSAGRYIRTVDQAEQAEKLDKTGRFGIHELGECAVGFCTHLTRRLNCLDTQNRITPFLYLVQFPF